MATAIPFSGFYEINKTANPKIIQHITVTLILPGNVFRKIV